MRVFDSGTKYPAELSYPGTNLTTVFTWDVTNTAGRVRAGTASTLFRGSGAGYYDLHETRCLWGHGVFHVHYAITGILVGYSITRGHSK